MGASISSILLNSMENLCLIKYAYCSYKSISPTYRYQNSKRHTVSLINAYCAGHASHRNYKKIIELVCLVNIYHIVG